MWHIRYILEIKHECMISIYLIYLIFSIFDVYNYLYLFYTYINRDVVREQYACTYFWDILLFSLTEGQKLTLFLSLLIYIERGRERVYASREGADRGRENPKQAPRSSWSSLQGSNPQTVRSWPEPQSRVCHLTASATQVTQFLLKYHKLIYIFLSRRLSSSIFWQNKTVVTVLPQ